MRPSALILAVVTLAVAPLAAMAAPGEPPAAIDRDRYVMHETADGWLRLDRRSGKISLCQAKYGKWTCAPVPDAALAYEAEARALEEDKRRLQARIRELEDRIGEIEQALRTPLPDGGPAKPSETPDATSREDQEFERFMDFSERAMRRFFGLVKTLRQEFEERT